MYKLCFYIGAKRIATMEIQKKDSNFDYLKNDAQRHGEYVQDYHDLAMVVMSSFGNDEVYCDVYEDGEFFKRLSKDSGKWNIKKV